MAWLLLAFSGLTLLAFAALFLGSEVTEDYFAWTIQPPLTAAFLGAGYGAGCVLVALSLRARTWAGARSPLLTILLFTLLTLLATLLHLNRFHFDSPGTTARFAAWFWMVTYVVVPPAMAILIAVQERAARPSGGRPRPIPAWLTGLLLVEGLVMLGVGVVMFVFPGTSDALWPWTMPPLSVRAVAAWLIAFGVAAGLAVRDGDLARLEIPSLAYAVFGVLELAALLRYRHEPDWDGPAAWIYLTLAVTVTLTGIAGLLAIRLTARQAAPSKNP